MILIKAIKIILKYEMNERKSGFGKIRNKVSRARKKVKNGRPLRSVETVLNTLPKYLERRHTVVDGLPEAFVRFVVHSEGCHNEFYVQHLLHVKEDLREPKFHSFLRQSHTTL